MTAIRKTDLCSNFSALPYCIANEAKATEIVEAIMAIFGTQAIAFFGGDSWYVLATFTPEMKSPKGQERLQLLMDLLQNLTVTPCDDYEVETALPDEEDPQASVVESLGFRAAEVINLAARIDEVSGKLDMIARLIGVPRASQEDA